MTTSGRDEKAAEEVRRLFAELGEIYARAAAAVPSPLSSDLNTHGRIGEERIKASAIIRRIREIQGL
jgi:hypothetical protein